MTLDEAIKHAEEVAEEKESEVQDLEYSKLDWRYEANQCSKCAKEHRQLAEWLKDYKRLLEQEPKKGHWIDERNDYGEIIHWHCSNCYDNSGYTTTCKWDYCPNCGADMREPKRGHWIPTHGNVKCSVCGSVKDSREVGKATHYCDFCGAKMIES